MRQSLINSRLVKKCDTQITEDAQIQGMLSREDIVGYLNTLLKLRVDVLVLGNKALRITCKKALTVPCFQGLIF
jgi:hypothetical protein